MIEVNSGSCCRHRQLHNGIHEFVFTQASREAVDEWFSCLLQTTAAAAPGTVTRCLVLSIAPDPLPVAYFFKRAQYWVRQAPPVRQTRVCFLHRSEFMYPHVKSFVRAWQLSYGNAVQFFAAGQRDEAERWLLAER